MRNRFRLWVLAPLTAGLALAALWPAAAANTLHPAAAARRDVRLAGPAPVVFQQLGHLYSIRVEVEPTFPARPLQLRLGEADFASALRIATQLAGAFSVEHPDGSVLVVEDTAPNRARYQPQVMKTFVLPGRTPEELTETVRLLREVLDMRRILPDPATNTFTVRDTPLRLAVAEALLEQLLAEPGEVWLDVHVLEVDRDLARQLGLVPPDTVIVQHLGAGALEPTDTDSLRASLAFLAQRGLLPAALQPGTGENAPLPPFTLFGGGATTYTAVFPGTELRLQQLSSVIRSTRHLLLRAREGEEATLFSGELFPVIFATFSSSFISPLERELRERGDFRPPVPAIRQEELGVRVRVRPRLHPLGEVTLALRLDQKALAGTELNGIPVISTRSLEQQARLRAGETLLVAGLRDESRQKTTRDASLLEDTATQTTEFIILFTPRLARAPVPDRLALRTVYIGTEDEFSPAGGPPAPAIQPQPPAPQPPPVRPPAPPQPPPEEEEEEEDR